MQDVPSGKGREVAEALFRAINEHDVAGFHSLFHDDSVYEYPQSGERIVGDAHRRGVYASFPGQPSVRRIMSSGNLAMVGAGVDYGDGADWRSVFVLELREAKIANLVAYWAKPFPPAESRGHSSSALMHRTGAPAGPTRRDD
jgi:ketosteroid isomerase-like protein